MLRNIPSKWGRTTATTPWRPYLPDRQLMPQGNQQIKPQNGILSPHTVAAAGDSVRADLVVRARGPSGAESVVPPPHGLGGRRGRRRPPPSADGAGSRSRPVLRVVRSAIGDRRSGGTW